jgi:CRISPR-associated protein Csb1
MNAVTTEMLDQWANDPTGPVALYLKQKLEPVEGKGRVIFPPTYADIGYNIDVLSDGTKVATIDSVGSQANRMEPIFKSTGKDEKGDELNRLAALVPQIEIILTEKKKDEKEKGEKNEKNKKKKDEDIREWRQSLLDFAHRGADAAVKATLGLNGKIADAFDALKYNNDAAPLCAIAPTSLLFGVWDSRGGSGEKLPRLVRSIIRAWDVDVLHSAAQFNSVWKLLDEEQQKVLEGKAKEKKLKLSEAGFKDAPATFRTNKVKSFVDDAVNFEARVLGGVIAKGEIERTVTINLVALRRLRGNNEDETRQIQKYLLSLALLAATAHNNDMFLREGCQLHYPDQPDIWMQVPYRGEPNSISHFPSYDILLDFAMQSVAPFKKKWPEELVYKFDLIEAEKLLTKIAKNKSDES